MQAGGFTWLALGEVGILLRPGEPEPTPEEYGRASVGLTLEVESLAETRSALESRGLVFEGFDMTECCPTFRDPDGHWVQLVEAGSH